MIDLLWWVDELNDFVVFVFAVLLMQMLDVNIPLIRMANSEAFIDPAGQSRKFSNPENFQISNPGKFPMCKPLLV